MGPGEHLESILRFGADAAAQSLRDKPVDQLNSLVWKRYYVLERTAPVFQERTNRGLFVLAVPMVALYQTLRQDFSLDQEPALSLAEKMLRDSYASRTGPVMIAALNALYQIRPVRRLLISQITTTTEPSGFRIENIDAPATIISFDVHACPIVNFAKQHGVPEVVPLICRIDDLVAEHLVGIEFHRTGTIGMGAERCDFRYTRTK
jgi:hypothetical protein